MRGTLIFPIVVFVEYQGKVFPLTTEESDGQLMAVFKNQLAAERFVKRHPLCQVGTIHMHEVTNGARITESDAPPATESP